MCPEVLSYLPHKFKSWNEKLSHLRPKSIFRLEKLGFLPSISLDLKYYVPLCVSCVFGTTRRRQWITKGNKPGYIIKDTDNNPGNGVSLDQLQSA